MNDQPTAPAAEPESTPSAPVDRGIRRVLWLIVISLVWYLLADRFTPYTQQARVQAFVVPVAAEVAGRVVRVPVRNNQMVEAGDPVQVGKIRTTNSGMSFYGFYRPTG